MPVLANPKHERFAQELAKGKTATEAYVIAGYKANDGNAATLKGNQRVLERVEEILSKASVRAEISIASLTEMYLQDRDLARELGQAAAAKGCVDSLGKLHGLLIERKEIGEPGEFDRMTDDELNDFIRKETASLSHGLSGETEAHGKASVRGKPSRIH